MSVHYSAQARYESADATSGRLGRLGLFIVLFVVLAALGVATAAAPDVVIRYAPLLTLPAIFAMALVRRSDEPVGDGLKATWLVLLLMVLCLWPTYALVKIGNLPALDLRRIVAGLSLVLAAYLVAAHRPESRRFVRELSPGAKLGCWIVGLYAADRLLSCVVAPDFQKSAIEVVWDLVYFYLLFFAAIVFFADDRARTRMQLTLAWLVIPITILAIVERTNGRNPLVALAPMNDEYKKAFEVLALDRIRGGVFRTQSTFEHPIMLAEFASMTACLGFALILWSNGRPLRRPLGAAAVLASLTSVWLSGSRSGLVAAGIGMLIVFLLKIVSPSRSTPPERSSSPAARMTVFFVLFALIVGAAIPAVKLLAEGRSTSEARSTSGRITMLYRGKASIVSHPILGTGPATGIRIAAIKDGPNRYTMDNYLLSIAIDSGLPGIGLFLLCLLWPVAVAIRRVAVGAGQAAGFMAGAAGALIALLITRSIVWAPANISIGMLLAAAILGSGPAPEPELPVEPEREPEPFGPRGALPKRWYVADPAPMPPRFNI